MKPAMMQDWKYSKIYMRTYKRGMHPIASFNKQRTVSLTFEINETVSLFLGYYDCFSCGVSLSVAPPPKVL